MTTSALTAALVTEYDHVPPALIASTVRAAAPPAGVDVADEDLVRADVAALADAVRRSSSGAR